MKNLALLASALFLVGCADTAVDTVTSSDTAPEASVSTPDTPETEVDSAPVVTDYQAGDSATLAIPEMHCPFGCFPKAKDTLESIDGIASIELVKQEEEGVINDRRVVVTFDGNVDSKTAIAALDGVDFAGSSFDDGETSDN